MMAYTVNSNRPNLGRVNPSDCVDMDCDGHKKVIITDMDGTFLGKYSFKHRGPLESHAAIQQSKIVF